MTYILLPALDFLRNLLDTRASIFTLQKILKLIVKEISNTAEYRFKVATS
jgi:hypothetical protein